AIGRVLQEKVVSHIPDVLEDPEYTFTEGQRLGGFRSVLSVPLLREGEPVGVITLTRSEPGPFSNRQIQLATTFADQAVIAIENARLFNETKEALERQTATADILKVIASSPSDVQPVFEAIVERSNRLVNGLSTGVFRLVSDMAHLVAFTPVSPAADAMMQAAFPAPVLQLWDETILTGEIYELVDAEVEYGTWPSMLEVVRARGWRSLLAVPLMRDGQPIGVITVTRVEPGRFDDHLVQLLRTFADQAVIAIENARLFEQVQARTRDLEEALQQQTATADVPKVNNPS